MNIPVLPTESTTASEHQFEDRVYDNVLYLLSYITIHLYLLPSGGNLCVKGYIHLSIFPIHLSYVTSHYEALKIHNVFPLHLIIL